MRSLFADDRGSDGGSLSGCEVAVCGRLLTLSPAEVAARVAARGGRCVSVPRGTTTYAIVTDQQSVGARRVAQLRAQGHAITALSEDEFLRLLGDDTDLGRLFSIDQMAQLAGIPAPAVRAFVRHGFLQPSRQVGRLQLFDFRQLACARDLAALQRDGIKPARLQRALKQMARWRRDAPALRDRLASLLLRDDLLVRLPDGRLAEPSGQLRLQFDLPPPRRAPARIVRDPLAEFETALAAEERGDYARARDGYLAALDGFGPEPEILFNLGNALFALGRPAEAASHFLASVQGDTEFAQAWNNLGNALARVGAHAHAILAYRQALAVEPEYADVHFNLAEVLHQSGAAAQARTHYEEYLRRDPFSRWARRARARLQGAAIEP